MPADDDADGRFAIPARPQRRYTRTGVEYEGQTTFALAPTPDRETEWLRRTVEAVLDGDEYTYGDWFDLPMPLYLVHDRTTGDVFRVSVRDGRVRFHVLPATESAGLAALYDRLADAAPDVEWSVDRRVDAP